MVITHVVAIAYKESLSGEQVEQFGKEAEALKTRVDRDGKPFLRSVKLGTKNVSPEGFGKNYNHLLLIEFENTKDRDDYLAHPKHIDFGNLIRPHVKDIFVYDFENGSANL